MKPRDPLCGAAGVGLVIMVLAGVILWLPASMPVAGPAPGVVAVRRAANAGFNQVLAHYRAQPRAVTLTELQLRAEQIQVVPPDNVLAAAKVIESALGVDGNRAVEPRPATDGDFDQASAIVIDVSVVLAADGKPADPPVYVFVLMDKDGRQASVTVAQRDLTAGQRVEIRSFEAWRQSGTRPPIVQPGFDIDSQVLSDMEKTTPGGGATVYKLTYVDKDGRVMISWTPAEEMPPALRSQYPLYEMARNNPNMRALLSSSLKIAEKRSSAESQSAPATQPADPNLKAGP
ncbi:MAG: hypothetical protein WD042_04050 [Phycisphaeraceae bacterium]